MVADPDDQDQQKVILDAGDDTIVADSIFPEIAEAGTCRPKVLGSSSGAARSRRNAMTRWAARLSSFDSSFFAAVSNSIRQTKLSLHVGEREGLALA